MNGIQLSENIFLLDSLCYLFEPDSAHQPSLTSRQFNEVPLPSQESERSCILVVRVTILPPFLWFFYYILELVRRRSVVFFHYITPWMFNIYNTRKEIQVCTWWLNTMTKIDSMVVLGLSWPHAIYFQINYIPWHE